MKDRMIWKSPILPRSTPTVCYACGESYLRRSFCREQRDHLEEHFWPGGTRQVCPRRWWWSQIRGDSSWGSCARRCHAAGMDPVWNPALREQAAPSLLHTEDGTKIDALYLAHLFIEHMNVCATTVRALNTYLHRKTNILMLAFCPGFTADYQMSMSLKCLQSKYPQRCQHATS